MFGRRWNRNESAREQLLLKSRETLISLKTVIDGLNSSLDAIETELAKTRESDHG